MEINFKSPIKVASQLVNRTAEVLNLGSKPKIVKYGESRTCIYFELELPRGKQIPSKAIALLYKLQKAEDADHNPSENTYNSLLKTTQHLYSTSKLVVPEPLATLPEMNGVIIEYIEGTALSKYLQTKKKQNLATLYKDIGIVIGIIHTQTSFLNNGSPKFYFELKIESIKNKVRKSNLKSLSVIQRALKLLDDTASTISWNNISCSLINGDLVHDNILITADEKIAIIDWPEARIDSPYHDISRFTTRTLLDYGYNLKLSPHFLTSLNCNFLKSYFKMYQENFNNKLLLLLLCF